jgi:hypothetical protein
MSLDPKQIIKLGYAEIVGSSRANYDSKNNTTSKRKAGAVDKIVNKILYMSPESVAEVGQQKRLATLAKTKTQ